MMPTVDQMIRATAKGLSGIPYVRDPVMKRDLLRSSAFVRAARRLVKRNPGVVDDLRATLELLSEDAFRPHRICLSNQWDLQEV